MGRSVSVPSRAEAVAYTAIDPDGIEDFQDQVTRRQVKRLPSIKQHRALCWQP